MPAMKFLLRFTLHRLPLHMLMLYARRDDETPTVCWRVYSYACHYLLFILTSCQSPLTRASACQHVADGDVITSTQAPTR